VVAKKGRVGGPFPHDAKTNLLLVAGRLSPCFAIAHSVFPVNGPGLAPFVNGAVLDDAFVALDAGFIGPQNAPARRADMETNGAINAMQIREVTRTRALVTVVHTRIHRGLRGAERYKSGNGCRGGAASNLVDDHWFRLSCAHVPSNRASGVANTA
jgi:hypothetical protein